VGVQVVFLASSSEVQNQDKLDVQVVFHRSLGSDGLHYSFAPPLISAMDAGLSQQTASERLYKLPSYGDLTALGAIKNIPSIPGV
jgi:hypothetical protein